MSKRLATDVTGMTCGGCVVAVRNVLSRLPGVSNVEVQLGRVALEVDEPSSEQRIVEAIARAGFTATGFEPA